MGQVPSPHKFRVNPVELTIFSLVAVIFVNSVYRLIYDWRGFREVAIEETTSSKRDPASTESLDFENAELICTGRSQKISTDSNKVRITGILCRNEGIPADLPLIDAQVTNKTNSFSATTHIDRVDERFSTDYMSLNPGANQLEVTFTFKGGKQLNRAIEITRE